MSTTIYTTNRQTIVTARKTKAKTRTKAPAKPKAQKSLATPAGKWTGSLEIVGRGTSPSQRVLLDACVTQEFASFIENCFRAYNKGEMNLAEFSD